MKASGLDASMLQNDKITKSFAANLSKTKDRLHNIELYYYMEPEDGADHVTWEKNLRDLVHLKNLDKFPTRYDMHKEIRKKIEHEIEQEATRRTKAFIPRSRKPGTLKFNKLSPKNTKIELQFEQGNDGDAIRTIENYAGVNGASTYSRTLIRKSVRGYCITPKTTLSNHLGPGCYQNTDPKILDSYPKENSYRNTFKVIPRNNDEIETDLKIRTRIQKRCEQLRSQYIQTISSKESKNENLHLIQLKEDDNEPHFQEGHRSRRSSNASASLSACMGKQLEHMLAQSHIFRRKSIDASDSLAVEGVTNNINHATSATKHSETVEIRRLSSTMSNSLLLSRRPSSVTCEFASKLLGVNEQKHNQNRFDYTRGALKKKEADPILPDAPISHLEDIIDNHEIELLSLTMLKEADRKLRKSSSTHSHPVGLSRKSSAKSDHHFDPRLTRNNSRMEPDMHSMSQGTSKSESAQDPVKFSQRSSSFGQGIHSKFSTSSIPGEVSKYSSFKHSSVIANSTHDEEIKQNQVNSLITSTYPPLTDDIGPLIRKWYEIKDIYSPEKPQISKYLKSLTPAPHVNLDGLLLPGENHHEIAAVIEEESSDSDTSEDEE